MYLSDSTTNVFKKISGLLLANQKAEKLGYGFKGEEFGRFYDKGDKFGKKQKGTPFSQDIYDRVTEYNEAGFDLSSTPENFNLIYSKLHKKYKKEGGCGGGRAKGCSIFKAGKPDLGSLLMNKDKQNSEKICLARTITNASDGIKLSPGKKENCSASS